VDYSSKRALDGNSLTAESTEQTLCSFMIYVLYSSKRALDGNSLTAESTEQTLHSFMIYVLYSWKTLSELYTLCLGNPVIIGYFT
jgi:hypothetical protein